jgi:hypothetical protein
MAALLAGSQVLIARGLLLAFVTALVTASCGPSARAGNSSGSLSAGDCEVGESITPRDVTIRQSTELKDAPDGSSIVNQKATSALGSTQYQEVDNTERLQEVCRAAAWSKVTVIEPDWLREVTGWVPASALREIVRDDAGARTYEADDFYWDSSTSGHKAELMKAVNSAIRAHPECAIPDPGTLSESPSRSRPSKPAYFITCTGSSGAVFNIWFDRQGRSVAP